MNVAAGPELAAAVTNAGGLGVIGGVGYTPKVLRSQVGLTWCWTSRERLMYLLSSDSYAEGAPKRQECAVWCRPLATAGWRWCPQDKCKSLAAPCIPCDDTCFIVRLH